MVAAGFVKISVTVVSLVVLVLVMGDMSGVVDLRESVVTVVIKWLECSSWNLSLLFLY